MAGAGRPGVRREGMLARARSVDGLDRTHWWHARTHWCCAAPIAPLWPCYTCHAPLVTPLLQWQSIVARGMRFTTVSRPPVARLPPQLHWVPKVLKDPAMVKAKGEKTKEVTATPAEAAVMTEAKKAK